MWLLSHSHKTRNFIRVGNVLVLFATLFPVPTTVPDIVCALPIFLEGIHRRRKVGEEEEKEEGKKEGKKGKQAGREADKQEQGSQYWFSISSGKAGRVRCSSYLRSQCFKAEVNIRIFFPWDNAEFKPEKRVQMSHQREGSLRWVSGIEQNENEKSREDKGIRNNLYKFKEL